MGKTNKVEKIKKPAKRYPNTKNDKKAQINNEIIQLQGKLKQAKVVTVRKIVNKLKHPDKNPKQNRAAKLERYEHILNQLKHMSPKRLGVLALLYYKSGKNCLADSNSTVEQLAVGYFCEHKSVIAILDAIRNKLNLDESSDWKRRVRRLFKKKDKTKKLEKIKRKDSFTETDTRKNPKTKDKMVKQHVDKNNQPKKEIKQKKKTTTAEQSESDDSSENSDEEDIEMKSPSEKNAADAPTTVDDFFITADGTNYLSTAVVTQKQEQDSGDESKQHHGNLFEKKSKEASFFHKNNKKPVKLATNRFDGPKRNWPIENNETVSKAKKTKIGTDLHPSWQAKQKLKPTITEFKGKKITFD